MTYITSYDYGATVPNFTKLDNKTSKDVETFITENNATFQYTPPDMHQTNTAKHAIRTWKNHFIAICVSAPSTYRLSYWCTDLEQTDITLNMLCPCTTNPGLWRHIWRSITFCFVVNDFVVKTVGLKHAKHLQTELEKHYECSMDWKGGLFCGVRLSMPDYARDALLKFGHQTPPRLQHSPYKAAPITYGSTMQEHQTNDTPPLSPEKKSRFLTKKDNLDFQKGAVLILSSIIKHAMASALETEIESLFYGCKEAIPLRVTLEEMGHPQPGPTPVTTDNLTAVWTHPQNHDSQSIKKHGCAFPMAEMQMGANTLQVPVGKRHQKQSQLPQQTPLHKASPIGQSQICPGPAPHLTQQLSSHRNDTCTIAQGDPHYYFSFIV
eukprot:CCRYP_012097-RA/>CCRYP_012097-RA protein AED:0.35 eAED:0.48 QI:0/0/0/1/0/0/2/0/379